MIVYSYMTMSFHPSLQQSREKKQEEIKDIAEKLHIQEKYLKALEDGDFHRIPSIGYGRQYLKTYAHYLNLEPKPLLEQFAKQYHYTQQREAVVRPQQKKRKEFSLVSHKLTLRRFAGVAVIVLLGVGYLSFSLAQSLQPPKLTVESPEENLITHDRQVEVRGVTDSEAQVTVNNQEVISDSQGNFSFTLEMQPGVQFIRIRSAKKHGLVNEQELRVLILEN